MAEIARRETRGKSIVMRDLIWFVCAAILFGMVGYSRSDDEVAEVKRYAVDSLDGVITRSGVYVDKAVSSDGNGSLRITVTKPTVVRLFDLNDIDIENARLIYQARLRTEDIEGQAYLEM
ncbi:MAG: hypothetical protein JSV60_02725 [Desulfobacterales bacterium]|nr:MAG: hypothetical protein JSV60_02725 [Desulfobacterales bacterium]